MHEINSLSAVTVLASLPHLDHLRLGSWVSPDQLGSSQPFIFPSLTCLEVTSIDASLLAALDCPQLQRLVFRTVSDPYKCLCVDSVPSLNACVGSLLKHCGYVRLSCGPGVTLTAVLEALAPWQPSAAALRTTGCALLPDALHPVATRLTQLQMLQLQDASDCSAEDLQLLASQSVQGRRLTVQFDSPSRKRKPTLLNTLESFPGVSHIIYSYLECVDRRACRLVCARLRTVIDGNITHVSIRLDPASAVEDTIERFARSFLRPNVLSIDGAYGSGRAEVASHLSSALFANKLLAALHAVRELRWHQVPAPLHLGMVDESSLAACTQLTSLETPTGFPGLSQLTQLQHVILYYIESLSTITDLACLPHLARLELGSCDRIDQLGSSQRYLFPSLTYLVFSEVNASLLGALDCPQLLRLELRIDLEYDKCLCVDSVPSLNACVGSLLKHCSYVRLSCGPGVTLTAVLEALAPWQPSAAAISSRSEGMGLMLDGEKQISASHLELLPTGLQELAFTECTLLPGALHPVATRLTQLKELLLYSESMQAQTVRVAVSPSQAASLPLLWKPRIDVANGSSKPSSPPSTSVLQCDMVGERGRWAFAHTCFRGVPVTAGAPNTGTAPAANNTPSLPAAAPVFADVEKITGLQPAQALDLLRSVLSSLNSIASAQPQAATVPPATAAGVGPLSYAGALTAAPILPEVGTSAAAAAADEIQRLRQQLVGVTAHLEAAQNEAVRVRAELSEMESLQDRQNVVMNRLRTPPGLAGGPPPAAPRGPYWNVSSSSSSGDHRGSRHSSQGGGRHAGRAAQAPPATAPVCPAPAAGGSTLPIPGYACHHCWNPNHFRDYCNLKHLPADEARRVSGYPRPASLGPPSRHANPPGDLPPRSQKRDRSPPGKGGWKQQSSRGDRRR
ncbi:hypothetical protein QJQ45_007494 [Haematococcus lacustris]|nr:hypothetical protein QJQ45_007494 [Haematococcus lacustris]